MSIADELITRGWTQGTEEDGRTGAVCLRGAAAYAYCHDIDFAWSLPDPVTDALRRSISPDSWLDQNIANWNDAPERTYDEVLRVAKQADELLGALASLDVERT